jgi:hypothetical protein
MTPAERFAILSRLTLNNSDNNNHPSAPSWNHEQDGIAAVANLDKDGWSQLHSLALSNHVLVRAFRTLRVRMADAPHSHCAQWREEALEAEQLRIEHALSCLQPICEALEDAGSVTVIKSLDHWPDLGNDLDLYTDAEAAAVTAIMRTRFHARLERQSWGDRLANKWNFAVPGLPELVEVHVGRLGQTGEQSLIGKSLTASGGPVRFGAHAFRVAAPEDRIMISTLQRMYRHFYIRLCDVVDLARLIDQDVIDYDYLRSLAEVTGLWDGVATYLKIVCDYVKENRNGGILLPTFVQAAARFGREQVCFGKDFLRIQVVPHCAKLYASELTRLLWNGEIVSTLRLSLMPALATVAALKHKITASDKGIW